MACLVANCDLLHFIRSLSASIRALPFIHDHCFNFFCKNSHLRTDKRADYLPLVNPTMIDESHSSINHQEVFLKTAGDGKHNEGPFSVFNAMDSMLKDTLERLMKIRKRKKPMKALRIWWRRGFLFILTIALLLPLNYGDLLKQQFCGRITLMIWHEADDLFLLISLILNS